LYLSKFVILSNTLELRLRGTYTINTALFYYFALRFPIFKHQLFSLILIGICVIFIIITEFIFQEINIFLSYSQLILALVIIFISLFFSALQDSIEKYLIEYNQFNPFLIVMIEGIFNFVFIFIYGLFNNL